MKDAAPAESVIVEMGAPLRKPLLPHDVTLDAVLSLSLLAQAGMLARLGVTLGTADAFDSATALMPVLPSNILGCFIMGALCDGKTVASVLRSAGAPANGKTMDAVSAEPLPLVPKLTAAWAPLLLGLRTGFCGSLTSYSTWNQSMVVLLLVHRDGRGCALAATLGLLSSLAALFLGQRVAVWAWLSRKQNLRHPEIGHSRTGHSRIEDPQIGHSQMEHPQCEEKRTQVQGEASGGRQGGTGGGQKMAQALEGTAAACGSDVGCCCSSGSGSSGGDKCRGSSGGHCCGGGDGSGGSGGSGRSVDCGGGTGAAHPPRCCLWPDAVSRLPRRPGLFRASPAWHGLYRAAAAFLLVGGCVLLVAISVTTSDPESVRVCVGALLAPAGAMLRWRMGKAWNGVCATAGRAGDRSACATVGSGGGRGGCHQGGEGRGGESEGDEGGRCGCCEGDAGGKNGGSDVCGGEVVRRGVSGCGGLSCKRDGCCSLFEDWPLGTLAANALASLLLALIAASAAAEDFTGADASTAGTGGGEGAAIGWRAKAALQGVGLGFCGCLSTVSTLANEVLALQAPRRRGADAYQCGCAGLSYPLATLVVCLAIGVAGYGWAVW